MAKKLILVPEEIYRGLTSNNYGDPNLDFTKRAVENAKSKKENLSAKNIHYNQELRRYLKLRNESENKPVRVEMVANPKGAIMNRDVIRPTTNITDDNDDLWMSDDFSYSAYPQEPPALSYNIVPPLSDSLNEQVDPKGRHRKLLRSGISPTPPTLRQKIKRKIEEDDYGQNKRRHLSNYKNERRDEYMKLSEKARSRKQNLERKNMLKNWRIPYTPEYNAPVDDDFPPSPPIPTIPEGLDAPLVSDSPPTRQITKRGQSEEFEGTKRWKKGYDEHHEAKLKREQKRREYLERKLNIREQRVPIDQSALVKTRKDDDIRRRLKLKRKWEGPDESPLIALKKVKPVTKIQSAKAGREWMLRLIKAKRKEAGIKRFKPTLW
uniref:Uncharacterized protein n=1 Tax=Meloidogyne enterolobii TaxID=390850 RepID=A0A6V7XN96_MELEN|nr:unnamed protein product [Meloidogyne enterolobii]